MAQIEVRFKPGRPDTVVNAEGKWIRAPEFDADWVARGQVTLKVVCQPGDLFQGLDGLECLQALFAEFDRQSDVLQVQVRVSLGEWPEKAIGGLAGKNFTLRTPAIVDGGPQDPHLDWKVDIADERVHAFNISIRASRGGDLLLEPPPSQALGNTAFFTFTRGRTWPVGKVANYVRYSQAVQTLNTLPGLTGRWSRSLRLILPDGPPELHDLLSRSQRAEDIQRLLHEAANSAVILRARDSGNGPRLLEGWSSHDSEGVPLGLVWCVIAALEDVPTTFQGIVQPEDPKRFRAVSRGALTRP